MAEITLHFLLVEDNPAHAEMIRRAFAAYSRPVRLTVVETVQQAQEHLSKYAADLVITDLILPNGKGTEILPAPQKSLSYPVIIMTSFGNEQAAVESIKAGALDYVVKSESILRDMPHIAERALRDWDRLIQLKQAEQALRESEAQLKSIFDNAAIGIYRTTPNGKILMANPILVQMLGYASFEELAQRNLEEEGFDADYPRARFKEKIGREGRITALDSTWKRQDGTPFYARENAIAVRDEYGNIRYYEGTIENITEQKRAEEKILEYQRQLQSLASQLSLTEERERRQLATALHDNIGQLLAISKIKQGSLADKSPPENRKTLEEIRTLTEQAIQYTRTLTFELSPPILYELGLGAAVEWLVDQTRQQHHIDIRFQTDNSNPPLEDDMRVLLFQAVRELLVNVAKHSQANKVQVALQRENHKVCIVVEDNGIGMESDQITTIGLKTVGFGLFNIRERLNLLGGTLNITSESGKGTKITLVAPLKIE
jgi:PAS domain S-box-containing protein